MKCACGKTEYSGGLCWDCLLAQRNPQSPKTPAPLLPSEKMKHPFQQTQSSETNDHYEAVLELPNLPNGQAQSLVVRLRKEDKEISGFLTHEIEGEHHELGALTVNQRQFHQITGTNPVYPENLTTQLANHLEALLSDSNAGNQEAAENSRWQAAQKTLEEFKALQP